MVSMQSAFSNPRAQFKCQPLLLLLLYIWCQHSISIFFSFQLLPACKNRKFTLFAEQWKCGTWPEFTVIVFHPASWLEKEAGCHDDSGPSITNSERWSITSSEHCSIVCSEHCTVIGSYWQDSKPLSEVEGGWREDFGWSWGHHRQLTPIVNWISASTKTDVTLAASAASAGTPEHELWTTNNTFYPFCRLTQADTATFSHVRVTAGGAGTDLWKDRQDLPTESWFLTSNHSLWLKFVGATRKQSRNPPFFLSFWGVSCFNLLVFLAQNICRGVEVNQVKLETGSPEVLATSVVVSSYSGPR